MSAASANELSILFTDRHLIALRRQRLGRGLLVQRFLGASVQSSILGTYLIARFTLAGFSLRLLRMFMQELSSCVLYEKAKDILRVF